MHWVRGGAGAEVVGPPVSGGGASALLRFFVNSSVAYFVSRRLRNFSPWRADRSSLRPPVRTHHGAAFLSSFPPCQMPESVYVLSSVSIRMPLCIFTRFSTRQNSMVVFSYLEGTCQSPVRAHLLLTLGI